MIALYVAPIPAHRQFYGDTEATKYTAKCVDHFHELVIVR